MIPYAAIDASRKPLRSSELRSYLLSEGLGESDVVGKHPNTIPPLATGKGVRPVQMGRPAME